MSKQKGKYDLKEDFISRLSEKKQHWIALAILFLLPLILYSAIFLGGKQFLGNDVLQWRAGSESVVEHIEEHNEHPLWATNMFSGMPSYVVHNPSSPYNVDTFIKKIGGDTHPLPYFWILLGGAYCFFVVMGMRPFSSALGATLIGFTTYLPIIIEAGHYSKFITFAFIPWMFVGYYLISRSDKKWLGFFTFALAVTLLLRGNHPQVTYYFLYLLGFWWIYDSWLFYQKAEIKDWLQRTGIAFGSGILAILCSIDLYWRLLEYAQYSTRGGSTLDTSQAGGLSLEYAFSWSQGVGELLTLIIPGLYGGSSGEAYWGPKSFTSGPHYFGAIAFVLALIGLIHYRKKIKYLFFGVGSLTMLFSLGYHFPLLNEFMFNYMPYFNKFRTPEMWLIVTVFCYSVLAVFGIEALISLAKNAKTSLNDLLIPLGVAIGIGVIFTLGSSALLSFEKPGEFNQYAQQLAQQNNVSPDNQRVQQGVSNYINTKLKPKRKEIASNDATRYLILVLIAGGLIVAFVQRKISKGYLLLGLLLLTAYDMLRIDARYVNEKRMVSDTFDAERMIQQRQQPVDTFILENINSNEGYPYRVFPLMRNPFNNAIPAYFYPTIGGYTGAKLAHYQDMVDQLLMKGQSGINHPILDMLNVKYVTAKQRLPFNGYSEVYNEEGQRVYRNEDVLPKAFFVDSIKTVSTPQQAVDLMQPTTGFNPASTAIVETKNAVTASEDTTSSVAVTSYKANSIELKTSTQEKDFLVLSEVFYPAGWTATIDGEATEIYKTNFILRGLEIPAGKHTIRMTFKPASNVWGSRIAWFGHIILWISGIGLLVFNFGWIGSNNEQQEDQSSKE
ncbi:YfhO family protein [Fodinibius saliphilus]|uniref:YfhO family protein n=1 Tax=Fodinibius saliphilus TaxID=1920650 RepID=UPI0011081BB4|nr:YfhO family protein [Fodinibius saliphilus]